MAQCQIQKCKTDDSDLQKINALARRELSADEIYVFNVTLISACPMIYCKLWGFIPLFAIFEQKVCLHT